MFHKQPSPLGCAHPWARVVYMDHKSLSIYYIICIYIYVYTVVSRKRAHGRCTLLCAQTGGWADICNIAAFYNKKAPMFTLSQPKAGYCTPTHTPSTSFSDCISQACVASCKWTGSSVLTFQEKDSKLL